MNWNALSCKMILICTVFVSSCGPEPSGGGNEDPCSYEGCNAGLPNGSPCDSPFFCSSGHCVDYVCCDSACLGSCKACTADRKSSGEDGTCGNVKPGPDPYGECEGQCNEQGICAKAAAGESCTTLSECASGYCVDGVCCLQSYCPQNDPCSVSVCGVGTGLCTDVPRTCPAGGTCTNGLCTGQCTGQLGLSGLPVIAGPAIEGALRRIALDDMDGDGDLDVVVSYYEEVFLQGETGQIGIKRNNGDGTFGPWEVWLGLYERVFLLSDLNNDGLSDVILAAVGEPKLLLRHNDGNGGFNSALDFDFTSSTSGAFKKIVATDLDGDGYRDLVLSEASSGKLFASLNSGGNSLGPLVDTGVILDALDDFDLADLNGDGKADLVHSLNAVNRVEVQLGNGDGSLAGGVKYSAVNLVTSVALGDINVDGKVDVVLSNDTDTVVRLGNGTGALGMPASYPGGSVRMADLNGDGLVDLLGATALFNNGNGMFSPQSMDYLPYENAALGDVDGDGLADIARVLWGGAAIDVQFNQGNGAFIRPYVPFDVNVPNRKYMTFIDLGGSTLVDLATVDAATGQVGVQMNVGNLNFAQKVEYPLGGPVDSAVISGADMNGDGKNDLVVSAGTDVFVLLNTGGGVLGPASKFTGSQMSAQGSVLGDFNADGRPDVARLVSAPNGGSIEVMLNQGNGTLAQGQQFALVEAAHRDLATADLNVDGYGDFVVHGTTENVSVFMNDGMGAAVFKPQPTLPFGFSIDAIVVGDVNGDGYQDVAFSSPQTDKWLFGQVSLNNGYGVFRHGPGAPYGVTTIADLDGNGLNDTMSWGNPVCVVLTGGTATWGCYETLGGQLVAADIDGDGIPELVSPYGGLHKVTCRP